MAQYLAGENRSACSKMWQQTLIRLNTVHLMHGINAVIYYSAVNITVSYALWKFIYWPPVYTEISRQLPLPRRWF
jgi:hypothetical protein